FLDRRLMLQEVPAVDGVVEMEPLAVALLAGQRIDAVDAALRADAVRAFDRRKAHDIDVDTQFGQLHRRRQARQPAADHHYSLLCHLLCLNGYGRRALRGLTSPARCLTAFVISVSRESHLIPSAETA